MWIWRHFVFWMFSHQRVYKKESVSIWVWMRDLLKARLESRCYATRQCFPLDSRTARDAARGQCRLECWQYLHNQRAAARCRRGFPPSCRCLRQPESVTPLPTGSGSDETGIQWNFNLEAMSYSSCCIKYLYVNKYASLDRQHHSISAVGRRLLKKLRFLFRNIFSSTQVCSNVMLCTSSEGKSALRRVFQNISHPKLQTPLTQA